MPRSLLDVLIAARHPPCGSPMTSSSGTNTSSRKISPNPVSPFSWAIGRTVMPSARKSNMKYVSPRCRSASGSERNSPKALSPNTARELQIFCPFSSQPPSVLVAVDRSEARSLPDSGSDQACAQISSPLAIFGSTRSSCSSVPCANRVGASIDVPFALARPGAPALKYSSSNATHCSRLASRPPYFLRPRDHRQSGVVKHLVPAPMLLEAFGGVVGLRRERLLVRGEEIPGLRPGTPRWRRRNPGPSSHLSQLGFDYLAGQVARQ